MRRTGVLVALATALLALSAAPSLAADTQRPTAVLDAPASVSVGAPLALSGSRSADVGGTVREYRWTVDTRAPVVTRDPTFSSPAGLAPGRIDVTLVVVDDSGNESAADLKRVVVVDDQRPSAVLDVPATVRVGAVIPLSGARSVDIGGSVREYVWTIDGGAPVRRTDATFTAAALPLGRHTVALVVTDDAGNESSPTSAAVIVVDDIAPSAVLDAPATAQAGATVQLGGSRSADIGGRILRYQWTVDTRPPVETTAPSFTTAALSAGTHTVSLVVTDDSGNESRADTRTIVVSSPPPGVKLTTFGKITLIAPVGKKTSQLDLRKGTLLAGRVVSPVATTLSAEFTAGKLRLGKTTVALAAGTAAQLRVTLSKRLRTALKGRKTLKVTVKTASRPRGGRTATKTTRTLTFTVS